MATQQWWYWRTTALNNGAVAYSPLQGGGTTQHHTDPDIYQRPCPAAGKVKGMVVILGTAPGAGNSYRYQLYKNGVASTNIDLTISDAATSGTVTADESISLADLIELMVTPSSTPATGTVQIWYWWEPTTDNEFVYFGGVNQLNTGTGQVYTCVSGDNHDAGGSDALYRRTVMPFAATLTRMYATMETAPGVGKTRTFLINKNASDEAGTSFTVVDANRTNGATGLSLALAAGDRIQYRQSATSGTPSSTWGMGFSCCIVPSSSGDFFIGHVSNGGQSNSAVRYGRIGWTTGSETWDATESNKQDTVGASVYARSLAVNMTSAPGAAKSNTFSLRLAAGDVGTALVFNDGSVVTGVATFSSGVALVLNDLIDVSCTPAGTPTIPGALNMTVGFNIADVSGGAIAPISMDMHLSLGVR